MIGDCPARALLFFAGQSFRIPGTKVTLNLDARPFLERATEIYETFFTTQTSGAVPSMTGDPETIVGEHFGFAQPGMSVSQKEAPQRI
jgi:hypothetical protein